MLDLKNRIEQKNSLAPAARTATANGTGVDLANREGAVVAFHSGTITDGTHTPKVQESDDNSTFSDVGAADQIGTLANIASNAIQEVGYIGTKRYIRAVVTVSGATTGGVYSAVAILGGAKKQPI